MNFILSIAAGLLSSYLFLVFFLLNKKPKILISNQISRIRFNGEQNYLFKFANLTNSEIFDVHIELTFYKPVGTFNGSNL